MANRQNTLLLKRSNIIGKIPPLSGLTLGEMALNTADAKLYSLYTSGSPSPSEVRQIGWDRISRTGDTVFGDFEISGSSLPSGYALSVTGDTNFVGDIYVQGDLNYDGNLTVSGTTFLQGLSATTISATTIGTSGDCIDDIYVSNIHSCSPLNINPLNEGNVYFGSTSGVTIDLTNNSVGIGTTTPSGQLQVGNYASNQNGIQINQGFINLSRVGQIYLSSIYGSYYGLIIKGNTANNLSLYSGLGGNDSPRFSGGVVGTTINDGANIRNVLDNGTGGAIFMDNVAIGLSGTTAKLHINNTTSGNTFLDNTNPDSSPFVIDASGNTGIGTTTPSAKLDVRAQGVLSTDIAFRVRNSGDTVNYLVVNGAGDVYSSGAGGSSSNTIFGFDTGRLVTGVNNTLYGSQVGNALTTGTNNTFIGRLVGQSITNQNSNTIVGCESGRFLIGSTNAFFGSEIGQLLVGNSNSIFGVASGYNLTGGSSNVLLGKDAGRSFGTGVGSDLRILNNYIFIGVDARANANNETNQIVIGHTAIGLGSNTTVIGNTGTTLFRPYGNVVIDGNLTVSGITGTTWFSGDSSSDLVRVTQTGSGNAFVVEDNTNPDSSPFVIDASGNTGIGVTSPTAKLQVKVNDFNVVNNGFAVSDSGNTSNYFTVNNVGQVGIRTPYTGSNNQFLIRNTNFAAAEVRFNVSDDYDFSILDNQGYGFSSNPNAININTRSTNGLINIWTQAANTTRLGLGGQDINPTVARTRTIITPVQSSSVAFIPTGGTAVEYSFESQGFTTFQPTGGTATYTQIQLRPTYNTTGAYSGTVRGLYYNPILTSLVGATHRAIETTTGDVIFGSTSGNVGIGTITPRENLDVSGNTIISSGLSASTVTITTQPTSGYTSTQILMRNSTSGQVEITDSTSPSIYNYGMTYAMTTFNYLT